MTAEPEGRPLVARVPAPEGTLYDLFSTHLAVHVRGWLAPDECDRYLRGVFEGRADWTEDWGGEQYSLGRAWYTHLEQDRSAEYFAGASSSNAAVERHLPGMQRRLTALIASLVGGEARVRAGWCGPGVHVFPAGEWVAREGGVVHFDTEGLSEPHLERRGRALSLVVMIGPPDEGGGLRVWDALYDGEDHVDEADLEGVAAETIAYGLGDLVVFDSYRLHQIQPFGGATDRVSLTAHAAEATAGRWEVWF